MENERYEYSPIIDREPLKWPNNAWLAVWVIINIEYFDIGSASFSGITTSSYVPDVRNYGAHDYGPRVGIWRVMETLDKYKIKATVALNAGVCDHFPVIIEEAKKREWEFMGHGISNSTLLANLTEDEEKKIIKTTLSAIASAVGKRPEGWLSPALTETFDTPDMLAKEGVKYLCDWCNDDQPYPMKVKTGNLISIPYTLNLNDLSSLLLAGHTPQQFYEMIKDQFDVLYQEGATQGRVMAIAVHPFVIGLPYLIGWFEKALQHICSHDKVWFARGSDIANWYYEHYYYR